MTRLSIKTLLVLLIFPVLLSASVLKPLSIPATRIQNDQTLIHILSTVSAGQDYRLIIPKGLWQIQSDVHIPVNVQLEIEKGAIIHIATGHHLIYKGPQIIAPLEQWISSANLNGVWLDSHQEISPEWWGAKAQKGHDSTAAIQAALNYSDVTVKLQSGTYVIKTQVQIAGSHIDIIGEPTTQICMDMRGVYSRDYTHYYGFNISGDQSQHALHFSNLRFVGKGQWGGIISKGLYLNKGWAEGGSPENPIVDTKNYEITRQSIRMDQCHFEKVIRAAVFLTNCQLIFKNSSVVGARDIDKIGTVVARGTNYVVFSGSTLEDFGEKGFSTSFAKNTTYTNLRCTTGGGALYVGYFNQHFYIDNVVVENAYPGKLSYYARDGIIQDVTMNASDGRYNYFFIQGAQNVTLNRVAITTPGKTALKLDYHDTFSDLSPKNIRFINSYFEASGKTISLHSARDISFSHSSIKGQVYGRNSRGIKFLDNTFIDNQTPTLATVSLYDASEIVIKRNVFNSMHQKSRSIYLNGQNKVSYIEIADNQLPNSSGSFPILLSYAQGGEGIVKGNYRVNGSRDHVLQTSHWDAALINSP